MDLLLTSFQRDANQHVGCFAPILLAFVDLGQMLTNAGDLFLE